MRALAIVRNYALAIFFLVLVGGVLLQPGKRSAPPTFHRAAATQPVVVAER